MLATVGQVRSLLSLVDTVLRGNTDNTNLEPMGLFSLDPNNAPSRVLPSGRQRKVSTPVARVQGS
jgi:hypothetical protein